MKLVELNTIFDVGHGSKLDANKMKFIDNGEINFISRDSKNNGCVGTVEKYNNTTPYSSGLITVSLGGSFLLSSFLQPKKFYTAQNVAVLVPKRKMNDAEKLFYCKCISMNRFKYSAFGREANKTLKFLKVPDEIPDWVHDTKIKNISGMDESYSNKRITLDIQKFKDFKIDTFFDVIGSKTTPKRILQKIGEGQYPYVTTQSKNNGVEGFYNIFTDEGNILVIDSAVKGYCSYQECNFTASDHVEKLIPKFKLNIFRALFLTTVINLEQFRYSYGRKFNQDRIKNTIIKLPVDDQGEPNWEFMEEYIKSIKFSKEIVKLST
ncbi:MAG: restriction endonuclease subunit S [Candidatus Woesearchaeota archaeon]